MLLVVDRGPGLCGIPRSTTYHVEYEAFPEPLSITMSRNRGLDLFMQALLGPNRTFAADA